MKIRAITLLILISVFLITSSCASNKKTHKIYYDRSWTKVHNPDQAVYYRLYQRTKDSLGRRLFMVKDYYKNGVLQMQGSYLNSLNNRSGTFTWYYDNQNKKEEGYYKDNKRQGEFIYWYISGKLETKSFYDKDTLCKYRLYYENDSIHVIADSYKHGEMNGQLISYFPNGKILRIENYENGKLLNSKCFSTTGEDTAYYPHYLSPRFPGGSDAFEKYLKNNLKVPDDAAYYGIRGQVLVAARIDTEGNIEESKITYSTNQIFNSEALRVVSNSPKLLPALRDGIPVEATIIFSVISPTK